MYAGQLVELNDAEQFFVEPLHPYSRKLMASVPKLRQTEEPEFISGQPPSLLDLPSGCRFAVRCDHRFELCESDPELIPMGQRKHVKCWLHQNGNSLVMPTSARFAPARLTRSPRPQRGRR